MSGFFDGLVNGNIRQPDVQWNVGPLPSVENGPAGSNGDADGRYNFNDNLLSGITPYAYGMSARMGSDRNYQQIPHRAQQIIPLLHLPNANFQIDDLVPVSHAVDMGDVAFIVGSSRVQGILFDRANQMDTTIMNSQLPSRNAFINLCTVNYLMAGLQRIEPSAKKKNSKMRSKNAWERLADDLFYNVEECDRRQEILMLFRVGFFPYGVCAGSENQGGKHETGLAPVQAAVNHVTTMTVDGQNRDLINFWRRYSLDNGDDIIYRLEWLPTQHYTLNHYYKGIARQSFTEMQYCWQVVPDVFRMCCDPPKSNPPAPFPYDYRLHGYWRVGKMFHSRLKCDLPVKYYNDDTCFLTGALLHINFAPVFVQHEFPEPLCVALPDKATRMKLISSKANTATGADKGVKRSFGFALGNNLSDPSASMGLGGGGLGDPSASTIPFSAPSTSTGSDLHSFLNFSAPAPAPTPASAPEEPTPDAARTSETPVSKTTAAPSAPKKIKVSAKSKANAPS